MLGTVFLLIVITLKSVPLLIIIKWPPYWQMAYEFQNPIHYLTFGKNKVISQFILSFKTHVERDVF